MREKVSFGLMLVLVCLVSVPNAFAYSDNMDDPYLSFAIQCYSIEGLLEQTSLFHYYDPSSFRERIIPYQDTLVTNHLSVHMMESLFDETGGITNVEFESDYYVFRPMECINVYAPIYQPPSYFDKPVCYVYYDLYINDKIVPFVLNTGYDGLSQNQHKMNSFAIFTNHIPAGIHDATLLIHVILCDGESQNSEELNLSFRLVVPMMKNR